MTPEHHDMVANILATYDRATPGQRMDGRAWYSTAGRIVKVIAGATFTDEVRVAYALAALSPRNPWRWNVADAYAYAAASSEGRPMPSATTFKRNQVNAWNALHSDNAPWNTAAPKVNAFVSAIQGNPLSVVVDVWAARVAGHTSKRITDSDYVAIAEAYKVAAALVGEQPANMQAITWLVATQEGTANHAKVHKAGTPTFIRALV